MRVSWAVLSSAGRKVEAQIFTPDQKSNRTVLFCPGFPGMGAVHFEQRHAAALVEHGYDVIVLRHGGTRFDGPHAPIMVNNGFRMLQARKRGDTHIGGGPSSIDEWLMEPHTALNSINDSYESIAVIGNSFGALAAMWSLTSAGIAHDKITHLILQAGAQGIEALMRIWKPEYLLMPRVTDKVALNDPNDIVATLKNLYTVLPDRMKSLPAAIDLTYVVVARDEILTLRDTEDFRQAIGGRGRVILDDYDQAYPDYNLMAHDMPDYRTEDLLAILNPASS